MMRVWCDGCAAYTLSWPSDLRGILNTDRADAIDRSYHVGLSMVGWPSMRARST